MNKILAILYVCLAVILLVFTFQLGPVYEIMASLNKTVDVEAIFFYFLLPLFVVIGIFTYAKSYKAIWFKISPFILACLGILGQILYTSLMGSCGEACGWYMLSAIVTAFITVGYGLLLLLTTYVARRMTGTIN